MNNNVCIYFGRWSICSRVFVVNVGKIVAWYWNFGYFRYCRGCS